MGNYYYNMTQLIGITDNEKSLNFYQENIISSKNRNIISQKEQLQLLTQVSNKLSSIKPLSIKFEVGKTYGTRSICDHNCIFEIKVTKRTDKTVTYEYSGEVRRSTIKIDSDGSEYIRPDNYSMAPTFRACKLA